MIKYTLRVFISLSLFSSVACSQNNNSEKPMLIEKYKVVNVPTHRYGGWYCPDNLRGFPAVNLNEWKSVPVVNGRMATKEETQSESSLIFVDTDKYPNAKHLDIEMPQLAYFESPYSNRKEIIIVIQALNIENDSIVGFRYLNGGNGSARLDEIQLISDADFSSMRGSQFASGTITIDATPEIVKEKMTDRKNEKIFRNIALNKDLKQNWRDNTNVNYHYMSSDDLSSEFANDLFGNFYIQNDYKTNHFTEKFLVSSNEDKNTTTLTYTCGPFIKDFETERDRLNEWAEKIKESSENNK